MSKIEELLKNEKVEWRKIGGIIKRYSEKAKKYPEIKTVYTVSKDYGIISSLEYWTKTASPSGNYQIFSEDISNYNVIKENMFAYNPARLNIGSISCLLNRENGLLSPMYVVFEIDENIIKPEFLLYFLKSPKILGQIDSMKESGARFRFDFKNWNRIEIPIPTLEIQEKIVKTLDKFTKYVSQLQTELQFRLKQYEYYRNMLLSENSLNEISSKLESQLIHGIHKIQFSKDEKNECVGIENYIIWCKIADVCLRQRGIPITAEKMKELHKDNAPVRIFAGGNTFADISIDDIDEKNVINTPSVVVKSRGNIDFEFYDKEFSHKNEMWSYSSLDNNILNIKFMYYYLKNNYRRYIQEPQIITKYQFPILKYKII